LTIIHFDGSISPAVGYPQESGALMMFFSLRAYLLVGFSICLLPLTSFADETLGRDESIRVAPPAPSPEDPPEAPVDEPDTSLESTDETPPNLPENPEDSMATSDLSDLETKSAAIRDNLRDAIELADQLAGELNALKEMSDVAAPVSDTFTVSATAGVADKVHVIIMADSRAVSGGSRNPIANGARENADMMKSLLGSQCFDTKVFPPVNHLSASGVRVLTGDRHFSFQKLQQEVTAANVGTNDVLFVYIACHGLTFSEGSHGFQMPIPNTNRELLRRSSVWDLMKTKKARQTILISDCCSNQLTVSENVAAGVAVRGMGTNALSRLLLYQTGDIDVNGCHRPPEDPGDGRGGGQFGIYREQGGFFTVAFEGAAKDTPVPVSWKTLFGNCQTKLSSQFNPPVPVTVPGRGTIKVTRQTLERIPD